MFKTNIIADKYLWLKTRPHFTLSFTEKNLIFLETFNIAIIKICYSIESRDRIHVKRVWIFIIC